MTDHPVELIGYALVGFGAFLGIASGTIFGLLYAILIAQIGITAVLYSVLNPNTS